MNRVILEPNGTLIFDGRVVAADPLGYLGCAITLADDCTLRSWFMLLRRHPALAALNPFTKTFLEGYDQSDAEDCRCDGVDHLALSRTVELIGHPGPPRMELSVSLDGISDGRPRDIRAYWLENLLDMPLELGRLNHRILGDTVENMQFDTVFNLFELIDGICWQLSFHHFPAACRLTF